MGDSINRGPQNGWFLYRKILLELMMTGGTPFQETIVIHLYSIFKHTPGVLLRIDSSYLSAYAEAFYRGIGGDPRLEIQVGT